ncbi:MAG: hypothetical protein CM15mP75_5660 [Flammeovirgaceae bacterium]|nr:MAG: hypothetical protein CM15mP75_5660 [Flammeovirgaceae bacterium]
MTANDRNMKTTPEIALKELLESSNEVAIFSWLHLIFQ